MLPQLHTINVYLFNRLVAIAIKKRDHVIVIAHATMWSDDVVFIAFSALVHNSVIGYLLIHEGISFIILYALQYGRLRNVDVWLGFLEVIT